MFLNNQRTKNYFSGYGKPFLSMKEVDAANPHEIPRCEIDFSPDEKRAQKAPLVVIHSRTYLKNNPEK